MGNERKLNIETVLGRQLMKLKLDAVGQKAREKSFFFQKRVEIQFEFRFSTVSFGSYDIISRKMLFQ